ncbi:MAG: dihydrolipoyl dehydrogenase [Rhodospirillales bacterium]|jgi:dihydrolipoamide dehydrogenase|nr:dihydrolipoyl dehydrogenase [Rhodospirillales bacterium]MBT4040637.1 dihydrolipoyl dehydrogenase [Rhodospirillales bacterium]MBT4626322.1 dihydrolipoyl dehydrogenase [Rhodospirillales bacterium]MBT5350226.1 dihydrolipoyl dehydrogenase [Rhodospirillales bacterium]MBT5520833.1 dihydrolipoyl dehydrogenase [Rhodospirillales bacterium]
MADTTFDVVIIGGGPGGYVTAIRGAQLGMKVAVVEKQHLGGICLNWGCIPTKALLRSAEILDYMNNAESYGLKADNVGFDLAKIVARSRGVSKQLNSGVGHLLKKNKVTVVDGEGKLNGPGQVDITKDGKTLPSLKAKHVIVATGARPRALPGLEADGKLVWSYFEALVPETMPKSLLVIGSGAIGIEFASFYNSLGADVTVVEVMSQVLPVEDAEIAAVARKQFEKHGLKIMTSAKVTNLAKGANNVTATIETEDGKSETLTVDRVISAVGVVGNIENIGLESTKIKTDRGCIVIDELCRTAETGVYAIGDVAGPPMLAHKAEHEGVICIEAIAGLNVHPLDKAKIPGCTYCHPQIASVGLTEGKAVAAGHEVRVGRFPFMGNGKAIALGEADGLVKTVFDAKTGELLGAHMVGAEVTELIQGFVVAMGLETTEEDLMHTVFPHPTLSEMMHESVLDAYGRVIHM